MTRLFGSRQRFLAIASKFAAILTLGFLAVSLTSCERTNRKNTEIQTLCEKDSQGNEQIKNANGVCIPDPKKTNGTNTTTGNECKDGYKAGTECLSTLDRAQEYCKDTFNKIYSSTDKICKEPSSKTDCDEFSETHEWKDSECVAKSAATEPGLQEFKLALYMENHHTEMEKMTLGLHIYHEKLKPENIVFEISNDPMTKEADATNTELALSATTITFTDEDGTKCSLKESPLIMKFSDFFGLEQPVEFKCTEK